MELKEIARVFMQILIRWVIRDSTRITVREEIFRVTLNLEGLFRKTLDNQVTPENLLVPKLVLLK